MAPKSVAWTSEAEELLISFVEARPCLFNPKDADYYKTEYKNQVFDECAQLLGPDFSGTMVKDRWANLRGTFLANHKRMFVKSGNSSEDAVARQPTWPLYSRLQFLAGCVKAKTSMSNLMQEASTSSAENTFEETQPRSTASQQTLVEAPQRLSGKSRLSESSDDHEFYSKKARRVATTNNQANISKAVAALEKFSAVEEDEHHHFGMFIAAGMRKNMDSLSCERAKLEIQQIMLKYHKDNIP